MPVQTPCRRGSECRSGDVTFDTKETTVGELLVDFITSPRRLRVGGGLAGLVGSLRA
jgi:hypothetical protein